MYTKQLKEMSPEDRKVEREGLRQAFSQKGTDLLAQKAAPLKKVKAQTTQLQPEEDQKAKDLMKEKADQLKELQQATNPQPEQI